MAPCCYRPRFVQFCPMLSHTAACHKHSTERCCSLHLPILPPSPLVIVIYHAWSAFARQLAGCPLVALASNPPASPSCPLQSSGSASTFAATHSPRWRQRQIPPSAPNRSGGQPNKCHIQQWSRRQRCGLLRRPATPGLHGVRPDPLLWVSGFCFRRLWRPQQGVGEAAGVIGILYCVSSPKRRRGSHALTALAPTCRNHTPPATQSTARPDCTHTRAHTHPLDKLLSLTGRPFSCRPLLSPPCVSFPRLFSGPCPPPPLLPPSSPATPSSRPLPVS